MSNWIDIVFKVWILLFIGLAYDNPRLIGQWKANVDIAYDEIWAEYVGDCDCTESLE